MATKHAKGMNLAVTAAFVDRNFSHEVRQQIHASLSPALKAVLADVRKSDWYRIDLQSELFSAIATASGEANAEATLRAVGTFISEEAMNLFMRLLIKMLTPQTFMRKFPDVWSRIFDFGRFEVDSSRYAQNQVRLSALDVDGFLHIGPTSAGWIENVFRAMGHDKVRVAYVENGANCTFDVSW